jgi:hypothetical protein
MTLLAGRLYQVDASLSPKVRCSRPACEIHAEESPSFTLTHGKSIGSRVISIASVGLVQPCRLLQLRMISAWAFPLCTVYSFYVFRRLDSRRFSE